MIFVDFCRISYRGKEIEKLRRSCGSADSYTVIKMKSGKKRMGMLSGKKNDLKMEKCLCQNVKSGKRNGAMVENIKLL